MINPNDITTIRLGQLPENGVSLSSKIAHEIGTDLKQTTVEDFAIFLGTYLGTDSSSVFNAISISDGQTLPTTTKKEFLLTGKGTYYNVAGGETLTLTKQFNVVMSNGTYWFLGFESDLTVDFSGIVQTIREGFTTTTPSEDAIFKALALKANVVDAGVSTMSNVIISSSIAHTYELPIGVQAIMVHVAQGFRFPITQWEQTGTTVTFLGTSTIGKRIDILTFTL